MVIANGFPKSGSHALQKAVRLLGVDSVLDHIPYGSSIDGTHLFIKRDPRNVIVSALRYMGRVVTQEAVRSEMASFSLTREGSLKDQMEKYEGWLTDPDVYVVRYEDLIASDAAMRGLAYHLGVDYVAGAFEALPGGTATWNIVRSDFSTLWSDETQSEWIAAGGVELMERWGYGD